MVLRGLALLPPVPRSRLLNLSLLRLSLMLHLWMMLRSLSTLIHCQKLSTLIIQVVVECFHHATRVRGLDINFSQGKTELLWHIIGRGSRALKERLHDAQDCLCWNSDGRRFQLRLTHSYKHLGTWMQVTGHHTREVAHRAGQALQSWGSLARPFYNKPYVGLAAKRTAFQSLTMSRMMFNSHTWIGLAESDLHSWQNRLRKPLGLMVRPFLRGVDPLQVDTFDLFALAQILSPIDQFHLARLQYFKRLLAYCPATLWDFLHQTILDHSSWLRSCSDSFAWFLQFYPVPGAPTDVTDLASWISYIALDSCWKGRLKKFRISLPLVSPC